MSGVMLMLWLLLIIFVAVKVCRPRVEEPVGRIDVENGREFLTLRFPSFWGRITTVQEGEHSLYSFSADGGAAWLLMTCQAPEWTDHHLELERQCGDWYMIVDRDPGWDEREQAAAWKTAGAVLRLPGYKDVLVLIAHANRPTARRLTGEFVDHNYVIIGGDNQAQA